MKTHISFRDWVMQATVFLAPAKWIFIIIFLQSCGDLSDTEITSVQEALRDSLVYISESWDINMYIIDDGRRQVNIRSPYGTSKITNTGTEMSLDGPVTISVIDSTGQTSTQVLCNSAFYASRQGIFTFLGEVKVSTSDNRILFTEHLVWEQQTRNIYSPGFVIITTPTDSITGYGLSGKEDLIEYTIHQVSGEFSIDNS